MDYSDYYSSFNLWRNFLVVKILKKKMIFDKNGKQITTINGEPLFGPTGKYDYINEIKEEFPNGIESFNKLNKQIMNENINLCELLEGHEGEEFYSLTEGTAILREIKKSCKYSIYAGSYYYTSEGKFNSDGECILFPSKDQRDWNKWAEEQKPKVPKTWNECCSMNKIGDIRIIVPDNKTYEQYPIAKSALALLKIHQLIEVGYGGNITNEEWEDVGISKYTIEYSPSDSNDVLYIDLVDIFNHIAFHTKKQAEEFLSYPENVELLKDYYMIPK